MTAHLTLEPRVARARTQRLPRALAGIRERLDTHVHPAAEPCRLPLPVPIPVRRPYPKVQAATAALALALGLVLSTAPAADAAPSWERTADGRLVDVQVLVDGNAAPLYFRPGTWDRQYFQAFRGRNYSLAVTNNSGQRVGVLISVDGLNVVSGERSSLAGTEPMYVLGPHERAVIRGWRTSLQNVRRFVFVDEERSYAERTGQANGDMGWIRVLSFREQRPQVWIAPPERRDRENEWQPYGSREPQREESGAQKTQERDSRLGDADAGRQQTLGGETGNGRQGAGAPSAKGEVSKPGTDSFRSQAAPESNPGTGWGTKSWDPVQRTVFVAAHSATDHIILRYEYESGLRALGIHPRNGRTWYRERGELSFAQPPRW